MTPQEMIERYAHDVARRLPKRMRADVETELRDLLLEDLSEREPSPDEKTTSDFLISFGAPAEVALRYHTPAPIIEPRDSRLFEGLAFGLTSIFAILALSAVISGNDGKGPPDKVAVDLTATSLQILGALAAVFWVKGMLDRAQCDAPDWKPSALPRVRDENHINRVAGLAAIVFWSIGLTMIIDPMILFAPFVGSNPPPALAQAFAYDDAFKTYRAPLLWPLVAAGIGLYAWATIEGHWRPLTRQISHALSIIIILLMVWSLFAGDIFVAEETDRGMKFGMALAAGFGIMRLWLRIGDDFAKIEAPPLKPSRS
jgi:hypothetical protein